MTRDSLRSSLYDITQQAKVSLSDRQVIEDLLTLAVIYALPAGVDEHTLVTHVHRAYSQCASMLPIGNGSLPDA
jgi:hypothetical protein